MALTEEQREIALRIAEQFRASVMDRRVYFGMGADDLFFVIERFLAALPKPEPVAEVDANDDGYWADILPNRSVKVGQLLYTEAPIAPPSSEQKPDENDAPFYDVEDEARSLCDELLTCGMDRWALQRALSEAYEAGNTAHQPDYKAQRDSLLDASEQLLIAVKHLRPCPGTVATMEDAIASVKGGE